MSEGLVLEANRLSKKFGGLQAVQDVSLCVSPGEIYGFIGPNGAGKTTAIRMMLGLIHPSAGTTQIFGHDVRRDFKRAMRFVGAMVEGPAFYDYLSARRNLRLFGRLSGGVGEERIGEVLQLVGLARRGDERVSGYSKGMRQRLGIALALLERPRFLIVDEPTSGLDPQGIREVRNLLRHVRDREETTIFLSSHLLAEMERICDRVGIIFRGRVIREGRVDELIGNETDVVELEVAPDEDARARSHLRERYGIESKRLRRGHLQFSRDAQDLASLNRSLVEAGFRVASIFARRKTLEECFVDLTGESGEVY